MAVKPENPEVPESVDAMTDAYKAWLLEAAQNAAAGQDWSNSLRNKVQNVLGSSVSAETLAEGTVNGWRNRGSVPVEPTRSALVTAVEELVDPLTEEFAKLVGEFDDFGDLVERLAAARETKQRNGGDQANAAATAKKQEALTTKLDSLLVNGKETTSEDIDSRSLRMGSWLTDAKIPDYVDREFHHQTHRQIRRRNRTHIHALEYRRLPRHIFGNERTRRSRAQNFG